MFAVVSGEIGSGKSMLVRSRLDELDASVLVGYVSSTQLSSDELRRAVAGAFGVPLNDQSMPGWEARFAGLLASLGAKGRRAVLVIDEAQHLDRAGLAVLDALVAGPSQASPLLEIWLVGQPEGGNCSMLRKSRPFAG
ncbi:MAG: AAA family ATPase [Methylibium sp.]|nr:AAA family ATPase [Methylibium sp.]